MLRTLLLIIIAILYLVLTLPILLVLLLIGRKDREKRDRIATSMIRWIFRVLQAGAGTRVTILGRERIPTDEPVLYVANHRSIFDIITVHPELVGIAGFVAKKSLSRVPIFVLWCRMIGCLFFDRKDIKEGVQMIRDGIALLESGQSLLIFPEGTRGKGDTELPLLPFHEGSFRIATRSRRPIVPVAITNTASVFEAHMPRVKRARVIIEFCEPIDPTTLDRQAQKQLGKRAAAVIEEAISRNRIGDLNP